MQESAHVVDIITSKKQGFGAVLNKIRAAKHADGQEVKDTPREPAAPKTPKDICSLIEHFKTLPKIYPRKPKKPKPKPTVVMIEKYEARKREREKAMSYVTKRRLQRVSFHCDTLADLFLTDNEQVSSKG